MIVQRDHAYDGLFFGPSWLARCRVCRQVLSRYDSTPDEAFANGEDALRTHVCESA